MSAQYLDKVFDIHAGGLDLIFPHHENEIAQSCCAHDTSEMARFWVHNGYVTVEGEKMSKSLGNFTTVRDALESHRGEAIRYALLNAHYRAPLDYSNQGVNEAKQALDRLYRAAGDAKASSEIPEEFISALCDDLNTPLAISLLHKMAKEANQGHLQAASDLKASAHMLGLLQENDESWAKNGGDAQGLSEADIEEMIAARQQARQNKDFAQADEIRDALSKQGISLLDSADGTSWERH